MENLKVYDFSLTNKVIAITGGYGYLGKAICYNLIHHGAKVMVLGKSSEKFKYTFKNSKLKKNIHFISCDISCSESIDSAFSEIVKKFDKIDILINNAYYSKGQNPLKISESEWNYGIDGTLSSIYRTIKYIAPLMIENKGGKIINVASMYGLVSPDFGVYRDYEEYLNPPHYGAAKAGVIQLTKYFANYLGHHNINVNSVTPGPFPNREVQKSEAFVEILKNKTALNRIGEPEDLAGIFTFLSSEASNFITGQNIIVDGGWTSR